MKKDEYLERRIARNFGLLEGYLIGHGAPEKILDCINTLAIDVAALSVSGGRPVPDSEIVVVEEFFKGTCWPPEQIETLNEEHPPITAVEVVAPVAKEAVEREEEASEEAEVKQGRRWEQWQKEKLLEMRGTERPWDEIAFITRKSINQCKTMYYYLKSHNRDVTTIGTKPGDDGHEVIETPAQIDLEEAVESKSTEWTPAMDKKLLEFRADRMPWADVAAEFGRPAANCQMRHFSLCRKDRVGG